MRSKRPRAGDAGPSCRRNAGQPPGVGGDGFEAGFGVDQLPGLVGDDQLELEGEGGEVGGRDAQQPA